MGRREGERMSVAERERKNECGGEKEKEGVWRRERERGSAGHKDDLLTQGRIFW